jgi:hypothetical protein
MRVRLALALLAATAASAVAQEPSAEAPKSKVAVLPFDGPRGPRVQAAITRALKSYADLMPEAEVAAAASQIPTKGLGNVVKDLGAQIIVLGSIRQEKTAWLLSVEVRNASGAPLGVFEYPLPTGRPDPATLKKACADVQGAVGVAAAAAAAPPPPEEEEPEEEEEEPAPPPTPPRPRPTYVEGSFGLLLSGRSFSFGKNSAGDGLATCQPGPTSCPSYHGSVAAGLRLDVTGYPLTYFEAREGVWRYWSGLGLGVTYDFVGWPGSSPTTQDPTVCGSVPNCRFTTREQRLEAGLRYRWPFLRRRMSPLLLGSFQYGYHSFTIAPLANGTTIVPNVGYSYLEMSAGARLPFLVRFSVAASVSGLVVLSSGAIQSAAEFGPGSGVGVRGNLSGEMRVWRNVTARLSAFYEALWLSFNGSGMPTKSTDGSATDAYWGFIASAGYVY